MRNQKMGFWAIVALVTGSQIGSSVFMLPANAAPFGLWSLLGLLLASLGAMSLALVFASLCARFPETGGPHVYVKHILGRKFAFFTGWTYWLISWISTTAVIITCIGYLTPLIGEQSTEMYLILQISLLAIITLLNLNGVYAAGSFEIFLTILKFIPLFILPLAVLPFFNIDNFSIAPHIQTLPTSNKLSQTIMLTMWGFIGLELATTPASSVDNPRTTIPKAIAVGTLLVAIFYLFNCLAIMGAVPGIELAASAAPYAYVARLTFGGNWHIIISLAAAVVCIGTLNAWVLSSGQVALGLAEDGFLPSYFEKKNSKDAPVLAILISTVGIVPFLLMTAQKDFASQMWMIVDISVTAFLFVYLICSLAYAALLYRLKDKSFISWVIALLAIIFCLFVIIKTPITTLLTAFTFTITGIPIYFLWFRKNESNKKKS
jgi:APA family basic amino acid/polyamine antiporter